MTAHHQDCDYHADQYPWECTCGATRPKASWFDATALRSAIYRAESYLEREGLVADNIRPKVAP